MTFRRFSPTDPSTLSVLLNRLGDDLMSTIVKAKLPPGVGEDLGIIPWLTERVAGLDTRVAGLDTAIDALESDPWVDLPLTSPWVPYSTSSTSYYPGVRARHTAAGVQIQGMVKGGGENTEICTLPAHLNPEFGGHFASISNSQPATVFISGTGQLRYLSGGASTAYVSVNLLVPLP